MFILVVYFLAMTVILVYSLFQLLLSIRYLRSKRGTRLVPDDPKVWPRVTVQLPVYNELYVVGRLMDAVGNLDYPRDRLQVQLIDDSTDESLEVGRAKVDELVSKGINAVHIRRPDRTGYKAGALQHALASATGECIAIFDADFVPNPDFLKKTIPWFSDDHIGLVQTKWTHLNRNHSILTRLQALALDMHFSVEQQGRNAAGHFMNFNGTAGVWRKRAIEDAGGWRDTTLTEDLDISYRAQLRGWMFQYLEDVRSPAELPIEMHALKSQQHRWNKGGAETARLLLPHVFRSKLRLSSKLHAAVHLLNSSVYLCVLLVAILSVPFLLAKSALSSTDLTPAYVFLSAMLLLTFAYFTSITQNSRGVDRWKRFLIEYPAFLSLSLGLSLHNSVAVIKGLVGKRTPFIRTPKFNLGAHGTWRGNKYVTRHLPVITWVEGLIAVYLVGGIIIGWQQRDFGMMPFHIVGAIGFATIFAYSLTHALLAPRS